MLAFTGEARQCPGRGRLPGAAARRRPGPEDVGVHVLTVAGRQGFPHGEPEGAPAAGLPLRPQEERGRAGLGIAAAREVVEMGDEEHPDPGAAHGADDLRAISEPPRSLVDAKDSMHSSMDPGVMCAARSSSPARPDSPSSAVTRELPPFAARTWPPTSQVGTIGGRAAVRGGSHRHFCGHNTQGRRFPAAGAGPHIIPLCRR
jgi:hypothetical protein